MLRPLSILMRIPSRLFNQSKISLTKILGSFLARRSGRARNSNCQLDSSSDIKDIIKNLCPLKFLSLLTQTPTTMTDKGKQPESNISLSAEEASSPLTLADLLAVLTMITGGMFLPLVLEYSTLTPHFQTFQCAHWWTAFVGRQQLLLNPKLMLLLVTLAPVSLFNLLFDLCLTYLYLDDFDYESFSVTSDESSGNEDGASSPSGPSAVPAPQAAPAPIVAPAMPAVPGPMPPAAPAPTPQAGPSNFVDPSTRWYTVFVGRRTGVFAGW